MANITIRGYSTIQRNFGSFKIYDLECAKRDLLNHFYTRKGSRVMNPTFGSIIPEIIFDPQTEDLEEAIKDDCIKIINQDPRFELENVNLESYDNGYNISLELNYVPLQQATILSIPFDKRSADARNT